MITFKVLSFTFEFNVSHTVNLLVTDIILNITSSEHFMFTYYISVQDYSNSLVKRYL